MRRIVLGLLMALLLAGAPPPPQGTRAAGTVAVVADPDAYRCAQPGSLTFEDLPDRASLAEGTFGGVRFTTTGGFTWQVGDFAAGGYNGKYPQGGYTSQGTRWAWLGESQGSGRIDFANGPASSISLLVSNVSPVSLDAYGADGALLASAGPAPANLGTGRMAELRVARATADIAHVIVHDSGSQFLVDALCTDAPAASWQPQRATVSIRATAGGTVAPQGEATYAIGTTAAIRATPAPGHALVGWVVDGVGRGSTNPLELLVQGDHTVEARFAPAPSYALALAATAGGGVGADPGGPSYAAGAVATLTASPSAGAVFTGWTVDGQFAGWASPLTLTMNGNHTVLATFAARPAFPDVPPSHPAHEAISRLAARGVIRGYADGRFGPADSTLRAQMAALIARAMGWDAEDRGTPFPDRGSVDADLWRNVGTLAFYQVARGYPDGRYRPTDPVLHAQVISFITRAMVAKGYWAQETAADPSLYPNITVASGHRWDVLTYHRNAGALPGTDPAAAWGAWDQPSTRGWFALAEWQALNAYWGADRVE